MKTVNLVLPFVLILLLSVAVQAQEETTLLMTFMPNIQFAPAYVGIEAGFFDDAGFDVSLEYLDEPVIVDLVATSEYEFAVVSGEQVILSASQSRPVVYVYAWFQEYPIGIVYSDELDVESMADLTNMRVGIPGHFGANYIALGAFLTASGMNETDVAVEEIGFAAPEVFCLGAVDAAVVYVNNEPLQIRNRIAAGDCGDVTGVDVLPISSTIDLVSNGLVTNQDSVENDSERVGAFVGAFDAALALTINNPAQAYLLSASYIDGLPLSDEFSAALETIAEDQDAFLATNPDREAVAESRVSTYESLAEDFDADTLLQFQILLASIDLWDAEQLGYTDAESWVNMQETLLDLGHLSSPIDLETLYTNEFLPEAESLGEIMQLKLEGLTVDFPAPDGGTMAALGPVSFNVEAGSFVALLGPSGSGKTTLIRVVAGLQAATAGRSLADGKPIFEPQSGIGLMFQDTTLMPWRTVEKNVALPLEVAGKQDYANQTNEVLYNLGLEEFAKSYPAELSGGMAQRVALGRVLIQEPSVLLLDEPFGALDAMTRETICLDLLKVWAQSRQTVMMVTHDIQEAVLMADRVIVLSCRPGRLIADIEVPLERPRNLEMVYTAPFIETAKAVRQAINRA